MQIACVNFLAMLMCEVEFGDFSLSAGVSSLLPILHMRKRLYMGLNWRPADHSQAAAVLHLKHCVHLILEVFWSSQKVHSTILENPPFMIMLSSYIKDKTNKRLKESLKKMNKIDTTLPPVSMCWNNTFTVVVTNIQ